jgi:peptidoglycan/LPS O-acetylase OafA/YrhL
MIKDLPDSWILEIATEAYYQREYVDFLGIALVWSVLAGIFACARRFDSRVNVFDCLTTLSVCVFIAWFAIDPKTEGISFGLHTVWAWWFGFLIEAVRLNRNANQTLHQNPDSAVAPSGSVS